MNLLTVFVVFNTIVLIDGSTNGSTPSLKAIVIGRCKEYFIEFKQKNTELNPSDCEGLWKKFQDSFAFKDPCELKLSDYEPFFNASREKDIFNKAMLWSGTYSTVHYYSYFDLRFTTLEDSFVGYMMNKLSWCGNPSLPRNSSDGIDYQSCPSCDRHNKIFWREASTIFAKRVRGIVRVMVNGTRGKLPAYRNTSIFAECELPNLKVPNITELLIIVIQAIGYKPDEKCGEKSISQLTKAAKNRGLNVRCVDDPDDVKHVLCIDKAKRKECRFLGDAPEEIKVWETIAIVFIVLFGVLLLLIVVLHVCRKKRPGKGQNWEDA